MLDPTSGLWRDIDKSRIVAKLFGWHLVWDGWASWRFWAHDADNIVCGPVAFTRYGLQSAP